MSLGDPKPFLKEQQLSRGPHRTKQKRANKRRWEQLQAAKQGPCRCCGGAPPNQLHHLAPWPKGSDTESNLVPLCRRCHERVTRYERDACAALRTSLSDHEYSYANEKLGEGEFEARYPVDYKAAI